MRVPINYHISEMESGVPGELFTLLLTTAQFKKNFKIVKNTENDIDYVISDKDGKPRVGIERKTMDDLVGSMESRRVHNQLKKIVDADLTPVLLVEGILPTAGQTKMLYQSLYGFMSKMSRSNIIVVHTISHAHSAKQILEMGLDLINGEFGQLRVPPIIIDADSPTLQALMTYPGVGEEMAIWIRKEYDSMIDFVTDCGNRKLGMSSRITSIKGIGEATADKIVEAVMKEWK